jgi:hypothetical protein
MTRRGAEGQVVSEVGQAPPSGAEGVPVRPPSQPSRVPLMIWCGIAVFCLAMFGAALVLWLWSRDALSSKDLKTATSVTITYQLKGNKTKSVVVNDPVELKALLDTLTITDTQTGAHYALTSGGGVDFTLPNGTVAKTMFVNQTQLYRTNWGLIIIGPDFYRKVNEIATRAEGRPIDVSRVDN